MRTRVLRMVLGNVLACAALTVASASASASALVRVNQVGFATDAPAKRAILMSTTNEASAVYSVINTATGLPAFSGTVPASTGAWGSGYPFIHPLDFSSIKTAGTYKVAVGGATPAISPSFRIDTAQRIYFPLLKDAEQLFLAQRDGPGATGSPLGNVPAHLTDRRAFAYATPSLNASGQLNGSPPLRRLSKTRIDVSGGWRDAGDNLKFLDVASVGAYELLFSLANYPNAASAARFAAEGRYGLDWLQKMYNDTTGTLYYQVALSDGTPSRSILGDHTQWALPNASDKLRIPVTNTSNPKYYLKYRPAFRANGPGPSTLHNVSPNLAGRMAGSFALCYRLLHATHAAYAGKCLKAAQDIFAKANTKPTALVQRVGGGGETIWHDDLELGATELYLAMKSGKTRPSGLLHTDPRFYLRSAARWANTYITRDGNPSRTNGYGATLDEGDMSGLAHYELAQAIVKAGNPPGLAVTRGRLIADIKAQVDFWRGVATNGFTGPHVFGNAFRFDDATAVHDFGLTVLSGLYRKLTGDASEATFAQQQVDYNFGANPWGVSDVVGAGSNYTQCVHHALANLNGNRNGSRTGKGILIGAVLTGYADSPPMATTYPGFGKYCLRTGPFGEPPFVSFSAKEDQRQGNYQDFYADFSHTENQTDWTATAALAYAAQVGS